MQEGKVFTGYEYKEITVPAEKASMYLDCYENFGWQLDENRAAAGGQPGIQGLYPAVRGTHSAGQRAHDITLYLKRDRKILNKMELTRLQRHFEACAHEVAVLERSKTQEPTMWALVVGLAGTIFMAGSTFAVVHEPPVIWLCILLAIPGFLGWILPYFVYQKLAERQTRKVMPLIEETLDEIYEICEKGHSLL